MLTRRFYSYLATLIKGESSAGLYIAVGSGEADWDSSPPVYRPGTLQLSNELARKSVASDDIQFLDDQGRTTDQVTTELRISSRFEEGEAEGTLRECGLFVSNGDSRVEPGELLSYFSHARIDKTADMLLTRSFRLSLTPSSTQPTQAVTRYLGNAASEELHDLENETAACQLDEIRYDRRVYFSSPQQAVALGYDYCAFCFGRELSQR